MENAKLKFIGIGSCFNTRMVNTSAYYYNPKTKHLFLIDCGEMIFSKLRYSPLLRKAKSIDILITHFHSDHAGSLESLIFFCQYAKHIIPNVIFPEPKVVYHKLDGVQREFYKVLTPEAYTKYAITARKQEHSPIFDSSYGYTITINGESFFYSGDAKNLSPEIIEQFNSGDITHIYHDVTELKGSIHLNVNDLAGLIPSDKRISITCMHFDNRKTRKMAKKLGFDIAKRVHFLTK